MTDHKSSVLSALETMYLGDLAAGERFKALAYKKVIDGIRKMPGPLNTIEDVTGMPGVGAKIKAKIQEILDTGSLRAAESVKARTDVGGMEVLLRVHGIGPVKARELMKAGIHTIAGLREAAEANPALLTDAQTLGLRFYEAGLQRIPRAEMLAHEATLQTITPPALTGTIVGSFRRGAADSGDVDMLLTYNGAVTAKAASAAFAQFITRLRDVYEVVEVLATGAKKWMGYVGLRGGTPRRLDLLLTPPTEFPFALLYFTGSDKFNVAFRRHCLDRGYSLNEHGFKQVADAAAAVPAMTTEADIFAFVGLMFVPPTERVGVEQIVCC